MSLEGLLNHWRSEKTIRENIVEWRTIPARQAAWVPLPRELPGSLVESLAHQGISALYTHQATSWEIVQKGATW